MTIRDAATVMLVRDNPHLEVFMLRRNPRAVFGPGAYVFPGGAVDDDDANVATSGRDHASTDRLMSRDGALRWWVAAAREAFEESGFLLSDRAVAGDLTDARKSLNAGDATFSGLLQARDVAVACDSMFLFSHWLTPEGQPRRYDTWFLLAHAPEGQIGTHDNAETVDSEWVRPGDMLRRWGNDEIELIFPTMRTLRVMEQFDNAHDIVAALANAEADGHANDQTSLLVDDASGERVMFAHEVRDDARRGWKPLEPSWQTDVDIERYEYEQLQRFSPDESVA